LSKGAEKIERKKPPLIQVDHKRDLITPGGVVESHKDIEIIKYKLLDPSFFGLYLVENHVLRRMPRAAHYFLRAFSAVSRGRRQ
jgi:hypothetical protein